MTHMSAAEIADNLRSEMPAMADRLRASVAACAGSGIDPAAVRVTCPEMHRAAWDRALELPEPETSMPSAVMPAKPGRPDAGVPTTHRATTAAGNGMRERAVPLASVDIIDAVVGQFPDATFADVQAEVRSLVPAVAAFDPAAAAALSAECDADRRDTAERYWVLAVPLDAAVAKLREAAPEGSDARVAARRLEELSGLMRIPGSAFVAERKATPAA